MEHEFEYEEPDDSPQAKYHFANSHLIEVEDVTGSPYEKSVILRTQTHDSDVNDTEDAYYRRSGYEDARSGSRSVPRERGNGNDTYTMDPRNRRKAFTREQGYDYGTYTTGPRNRYRTFPGAPPQFERAYHSSRTRNDQYGHHYDYRNYGQHPPYNATRTKNRQDKTDITELIETFSGIHKGTEFYGAVCREGPGYWAGVWKTLGNYDMETALTSTILFETGQEAKMELLEKIRRGGLYQNWVLRD